MKPFSILLILICPMILGCDFISTDWDCELWVQKIENSNLRVFKFDAWGGRDSHKYGLKINTELEGFSQKDVLSKDKFSHFVSIPNANNIHTINLIRTNLGTKPSYLKSSNIQDIKGLSTRIDNYEFNTAIGNDPICYLQIYKFESFRETRDSLIFYKNTSQFVDGIDCERISIPKGNVYLMTSKDNLDVLRITYDHIFIQKMDDTQTDSSSVRICHITKYFDPTTKIKVNEISDYGIYKPVK